MATGRLFRTTGGADRRIVWNAAKRRRRATSAVPELTPLQRILALSPSALWWPQQGAGWQGTSGGTLAATGQPVGLVPDLSQLGGKTQAEWLASAAELAPTAGSLSGTVENDGGASSSFSAGVWTIATPSSLSGYPRVNVSVPGITAGKVYRVTGEIALTGISAVTMRLASAGAVNNIGAGITTVFDGTVSAATANQINIFPSGTPSGTLTFVSLSVKELPGNHLRAGTWASPSDAARATLTAEGALNFDGINDYYSLLNAINITTNMTVVRAFKRASAGIRSIGLGGSAGNLPRDTTWNILNDTSVSLGSSGAFAPDLGNTATGAYVFAARRSATAEIIRRNGVQLGTRSPPTLGGSFDVFGRLGSEYNSGEISFLAVFPTELTGADLALVEQIAASTNGSVLA